MSIIFDRFSDRHSLDIIEPDEDLREYEDGEKPGAEDGELSPEQNQTTAP